MFTNKSTSELRVFAEEIRLATFREFSTLSAGHIGGAMSIVEALAVLYGRYMAVDPANPRWRQRDWLVLSKGHAGAALYAALCLRGFFPEEQLLTLNKNGTSLPSHCDRNKTPGVDMTTGSLGQGISAALGIALGNRLSNFDSYTYLVVGDGECNEGQVWEAAMAASMFKTDRLIAFCDYNMQQLDGYTKNVMDMGDMAAKWRAFGWFTQEVDGHDIGQLCDAVDKARGNTGTPSMIVMHTKKGNGCSFAVDKEANHHISFTPEQIEIEIENTKAAITAAKNAC